MAKKEHKINEDIKHKKVFTVFEGKDIKEVMDTNKALDIADKHDMDLVMMNENGDNPVCKIMDYNKFMYDKKKSEKNNKNNQKQKEMRFTPNIGDHDLGVKINKVKDFLKKGDSAKLVVFFKGREMADTDKGKYILYKAIDELENDCIVDKLPTMAGNKMEAIIKPKKE